MGSVSHIILKEGTITGAKSRQQTQHDVDAKFLESNPSFSLVPLMVWWWGHSKFVSWENRGFVQSLPYLLDMRSLHRWPLKWEWDPRKQMERWENLAPLISWEARTQTSRPGPTALLTSVLQECENAGFVVFLGIFVSATFSSFVFPYYKNHLAWY